MLLLSVSFLSLFRTHMDIRLWEWNLNVIFIECLVDALQYLAIVHILRPYIDPYKYLEDDSRVAKFLEDNACLLSSFIMDALEAVNSIEQQLSALRSVSTISYAYIKDMALIAMVAGKVLVVLCEKL